MWVKLNRVIFQLCRKKSGTLAEMADEKTMIDVINYVNKYGKPKVNETFWIGLRKKECWVWNSNTPVCYKAWHKKYPKDGEGGISTAFIKHLYT